MNGYAIYRSMNRNSILIIDDDQMYVNRLERLLGRKGFIILKESFAGKTCTGILSKRPDFVILDITIQNNSGFKILTFLRQAYHGPIMVLTANDNDEDQILSLNLGADDYVLKNVDQIVLVARIQALYRRAYPEKKGESADTVVIGDLKVDCRRREVLLRGKLVRLTTFQFDILRYLALNAGKVVSREDIHQVFYNSEYNGIDRSIDVYISRIRQKLGDNPVSPNLLKTVRGIGYLLMSDKNER